LNNSIKKVTEDIEERFNFNTAISFIMELVNALYYYKERVILEKRNIGILQEALDSVVLLLAPFIPHVTEELWQILGKKDSVHNQSWPTYDKSAIIKDEIEIVIQINGKIKDKILVSLDLEQKEIEKRALNNEKILELIKDKNIIKIIGVPGKLVNIVIK